MPKPRRKSQVQLVSLGLSQVEPDLGCPQQVSPLRARCLGARTLQGKDRLSGLVWGEPAISGVPLSSARTFMCHTESQSGCPARPLGCQGAPAQSHSPKPASVSQGVSEKCPLSPQGCPQWRDGPCSREKHCPFLEIVTRGAASAAPASACWSPQHA